MNEYTKRFRVLCGALATAALLCAGCMTSNPGRLHKKVAAWVPVGTSVEDGTRIMESHGFRCTASHDPDGRPWGGAILRCRRTNRLLNKSWNVDLFLDHERVAGSSEAVVMDLLRMSHMH